MNLDRGLGEVFVKVRLATLTGLVLLAVAVPAVAQPTGETPVLIFQKGPWGLPSASVGVDVGPGELTVAFWLYRIAERSENDLLVTQWIIGEPFIHFGFELGADGILKFQSSTGAPGSGTLVSSPAPLPLRSWIHVAGTVDAQNIRLFLDGVEVASDVTFGALGPPASEPFWMRGQAEVISSIQLWSRAMTGTEIMTFAGTPPVGDEAGLISFWPLDEGAWDADESRNLVASGPPLSIGSPDVHPADPGWLPSRALDGFPYFAIHSLSEVPDRAVLVDLDQDRDLDLVGTATLDHELVVEYPYYPSPAPDPTRAYENTGGFEFVLNESWVEPVGEVQTMTPGSVSIADLNGDGLDDVFIAEGGPHSSPLAPDRFNENPPGGKSRVLIQQPGGGLRDETDTRFPQMDSFTHAASTGDVDGDGDVDIFVGRIAFEGDHLCHTNPPTEGGPCTAFYINDGAGFFTQTYDNVPEKYVTNEVHADKPALVDVDEDGDPDLFLGLKNNDGDDRDGLYLNDGAGNFSAAPEDMLPLRPDSTFETASLWVRQADLNFDGRKDLLIILEFVEPGDPTFQILLRQSDGNFRDGTDEILGSVRTPHNQFGSDLAVGDFNGDGLNDIVYVGDGPAILWRTPSGFETHSAHTMGIAGVANLEVGDIDGDGDLDVYFGSGHFLENLSPFEIPRPSRRRGARRE